MSKRMPIDFTQYPFDRMNVAGLRALKPSRSDFEMRQASPAELKEMDSFVAGVFDTTYDAEIVLKLEEEDLQTPHVYFYLVRRFGFPQSGCDDYKQMGVYYLTTPRPDTVLRVLVLAKMILFSVLTTRDTARACYRADVGPILKRNRRFRRWAQKNHKITVANSFDVTDDAYLPKINLDYGRWLKKTYPKTDFSQLAGERRKKFLDRAQRRYFKFKDAQYEKLFKKFGDEFPALRQVRPNAYESFKNGILGKVRLAACRAVLDLLRPVYVRDVYFNIKKYLSDDEAGKMKTAPFSNFAGYGIPVETYAAIDAGRLAPSTDETGRKPRRSKRGKMVAKSSAAAQKFPRPKTFKAPATTARTGRRKKSKRLSAAAAC